MVDFDKGGRRPSPSPDRHPGGRSCEMQALVLTVLAPIAIPVLVARTVWLRRKGRI